MTTIPRRRSPDQKSVDESRRFGSLSRPSEAFETSQDEFAGRSCLHDKVTRGEGRLGISFARLGNVLSNFMIKESLPLTDGTTADLRPQWNVDGKSVIFERRTATGSMLLRAELRGPQLGESRSPQPVQRRVAHARPGGLLRPDGCLCQQSIGVACDMAGPPRQGPGRTASHCRSRMKPTAVRRRGRTAPGTSRSFESPGAASPISSSGGSARRISRSRRAGWMAISPGSCRGARTCSFTPPATVTTVSSREM